MMPEEMSESGLGRAGVRPGKLYERYRQARLELRQETERGQARPGGAGLVTDVRSRADEARASSPPAQFLQLHLVDVSQIRRACGDADADLPEAELAEFARRHPRAGLNVRRQSAQAARLLARTAIGAAAGRPPAEIRFAVNAWGRPCLVDPPRHADAAEGATAGSRVGGADPSVLDFNASHDGGLLALVVGRGVCGIDVEDAPDSSLREIAYRFCGAGDREFLVGRGSARELWAAKESAAKALGRGLRAGLGSIQFVGRPGRRWANVLWRGHPVPLRTRVVDLGVRHLAVTVAVRPSQVRVHIWQPTRIADRWQLRRAEAPSAALARAAAEIGNCLSSCGTEK